MRKVGRVVLAAVALSLAASGVHAQRLPLPQPNPERGTIAVTMRCRAPAGPKSPAEQVFFVRLAEDVDMLAAESVIPSNFSKGKQVHLLNSISELFNRLRWDKEGPS
ncbi:MAG: hypothetical protein GY769_25395 [bacterium]|nr:hypothetical protein [bacterium]